MRSDEWRGVKWWRRGTYCCKGCRSRRAGAGREHWGAPSSFPLSRSPSFLCLQFFSAAAFCVASLLFSYPWNAAFISLGEARKTIWGKNVRRHPGVQQADKQESWRRSERQRCASVCVREKTTGWRRTPPTVAREREKHSFSLALSLACSLTPTHPSSLALLILRECLISLTRCLSPCLSPPPSVLAACRSRNWEAVPNDWSSEVCEMWINWQNLSFSLHKWNH